jgi:nucleoside-diphosphate-sugar epimerase
MKALVIGGTGPTGPHVVNGLVSRGFEVAILHTGRHEVDTIPATVEHLHTNPFDIGMVGECLGARTFDVVYAMYGRLRNLAPFFRGRCGRFVAVGGVPAYRGYARPQRLWPTGLQVPVREDAERAVDDENVKVARIVATEDVVFEAHPDATIFRYPQIYGPGQIIPREWMIVRRVLDGRRRVIVADGGLTLRTVGYSANVAHALVLAVERSDAAAGKAYNVGDEHVLTVRQTIEVLGRALGHDLEIVSLPMELATPARPFMSSDTSLHGFLGVDAIRHDLGYRDVLPTVEALTLTARNLVDHPIERGSVTEMRLQDPFDYAAEDRLIERYRALLAEVRPVADAYDPDYRDRYAPGSDDWRLVEARS